MLEIGSLVDGKYKILNKVGQGGMSVVYLAMNEKANKQWAVKEVRKDGVLDFESVKQGLVAETDILKKLSHPNLPSIVDVIDTDESFIIIMDYIQGNSLNLALEEFGAQPQENVIEWAKQLCDVLGYLHSRQPPIIYRDMKPANIMLKPDGNVTLIDFGTAREFKEKNLADTTCLGTVGYAAPEQFGGMGQTDARTDIYCLGATLYHLVTGMNPCEPPYEILPIRDVNPSLSGGLERIILKCTQRDPDDRYQSAAELMYALEHYNEIDDIYRKKQKKKLWQFLTPVILSVVFMAVALAGFVAAQKNIKQSYNSDFVKAATADDYMDLIALDPGRYEAYLGSTDYKDKGLINLLIQDDVLNGKEQEYFTSLRNGLNSKDALGYSTTVDALAEFEKEDRKNYLEACNEIGMAYLFCYDVNVEKDKYSAASVWFKKVKDETEKDKKVYPLAKYYCEISECLENIANYKNTDQVKIISDSYEDLWNKLTDLKKDVEEEYLDDDEGLGIKIRVWNEIVKIINNNVKEFNDVRKSMDGLQKMLDDIYEESSKIDNSIVKNKNEELQSNIKETIKKVNSVKKSAG